MSEDGDEEKVGYKKPPKNHRFKPGQSGNLNGRPKKVRQASDITRILVEPISVRDRRGQRQIEGHEAVFRKLVQRAVKDLNLRAAITFIKLCMQYDIIPKAPQIPQGGVLTIPKTWTLSEWSDTYKRLGPPPWPGLRDGMPIHPKNFQGL